MTAPLDHRVSTDSTVVASTPHQLAPTWVRPVFALLAAALVPWIIWLAATLPARQQTEHYRTAWVGFDVALSLAILGIAATAMRGSDRLEVVATAAAVLLLVDAWFDVMTSRPGVGFGEASVEAAAIEIPLAVVSFWIARHADAVRRRCAELRGQQLAPPRRSNDVACGYAATPSRTVAANCQLVQRDPSPLSSIRKGHLS